MRRIVIAIGTTLTGLVLLFSWPTSLNRAGTASGTGTGDAGTGTAGAGTSTSSGTSSSGTSSSGTSSSDAEAAAPTPVTATYDGAAIATRFGDVQVRITVTDGVVTAAEAIAYPDHSGHDRQINAYAIPILNDEAVTAQSASIDMVSGASVTSNGYIQSLQDALDQAGL